MMLPWVLLFFGSALVILIGAILAKRSFGGGVAGCLAVIGLGVLAVSLGLIAITARKEMDSRHDEWTKEYTFRPLKKEAKTIRLDDTEILVGHNVSFTYSYLQELNQKGGKIVFQDGSTINVERFLWDGPYGIRPSARDQFLYQIKKIETNKAGEAKLVLSARSN